LVTIRCETPDELLTYLNLVTSSPSSPIHDELALELGEAPEDIYQEVVRGAFVCGNLSEDHLDSATFEIALQEAEVRYIAGETIDVVNENGVECGVQSIIAKTIERRPSEEGAAPACVLIDAHDRPAAFICEALQVGDLGVDGLPCGLLLCGDTRVEYDGATIVGGVRH
jgi:hypothetical protein